MSDSVARGSVLWCSKDSASYNSLQARWAKNPKLRKWWQNLSLDEQVQWFLKWQNPQWKRRFDEVIYTEVSTRAEELIEDDVTKFKLTSSSCSEVSSSESPDSNSSRTSRT